MYSFGQCGCTQFENSLRRKKLNAGSTLVAVMLDSSRNLYWNSVGDSRLYLFRDGDFAQITQDHNYTTVLLEKLNAGMIDREEFNSENLKGEALISFFGHFRFAAC